MSDEISTPSPLPAPEGYDSWRAYWQAQGQPWRTEPKIDAERQAYLAERRAVTPDIEHGIYPFRDENDSIKLSRADVEWLLAKHESRCVTGPVVWNDEAGKPDTERRDGLDLRGADLRGADLRGMPLARMRGGLSSLERSGLSILAGELAGIQLQDAFLSAIHLEDAILGNVHLEGADLYQAQLNRGSMFRAHLGRADLRVANLAGVDLRLAVLDVRTELESALLSSQQDGGIWVADTRWGGAGLGSIDWSPVRKLGDEHTAQSGQLPGGTVHSSPLPVRLQRAVRAYTQLAALLRTQGLSQDANRFTYRAQVLQRNLFGRQGELGQWLVSLALWALSGYGYKLWRIFAAYAIVVLLFSAGYLIPAILSSQGQLPTGQGILNALQISLNAIHGRVFFAQFGLDTLQSWLATVESIVGIVIEGVFVAMLVQRFFAR